MKKNIRHTENGLSLIEIALALIVVGFLTVAFLQIYQIQEAKRLDEAQQYKIFTIKDALNKYLSNNDHYPCPGVRNTSTFDSDFARSSSDHADNETCNTSLAGIVENAPCDDTDPYCRAQLPGKDIVRIGVIPYKEIGIGREDAIDVYGNQFTYAVAESQATKGLYQNPADAGDREAIQVQTIDCVDVNGVCDPVAPGATVTLDHDILFLSHGALGAGSFTSYGTLNATSCANGTGTGDQENCDNDAIFVTPEFAMFRDGQTGLPDDELTYELLDWTFIWDGAEDTKSIYNRAIGSMGVGLLGSDEPAEKLHVKNGNVRVESDLIDLDDAGKVQALRYCDTTETSCFDPAVFGSVKPADPADEDKRLRCDEGYFLAGVISGSPHCVSILTNSTKICDTVNGKPAFITKVTINPDTGQLTGTCDTPF